MAVVIRLSRMGKKGERKFRIVVKEKRSRRDGDNVEVLGWYQKTEKGITKQLDQDRYKYWLSQGAKPSETVSEIANSK